MPIYSDAFRYSQVTGIAISSLSYVMKEISRPNLGKDSILPKMQSNLLLETFLRVSYILQIKMSSTEILKLQMYLCTTKRLKLQILDSLNSRSKIILYKFRTKFKDINIGSPIYMSPQGFIENIYGPKTDIWAFGVLIYELLHG